MNLVARSDVPKAESAIAVQSRDGIDLPRHRSTIWIDPCHPSPTKSRAKIWKAYSTLAGDRKRVVWGKSVSVRVDLGGSRTIKKKKKKDTITSNKKKEQVQK